MCVVLCAIQKNLYNKKNDILTKFCKFFFIQIQSHLCAQCLSMLSL